MSKPNNIKVLIVGANGFLGTNLLKFYQNHHLYEKGYEFLAADISNNHIDIKIPFSYLDITESTNSYNTILKLKPDVIILTAALSDVDKCEVNKELAYSVNVIGPENITNICKKLKSKLIFLSTDYVFDGCKRNGYYSENDIPNPLNYYAQTKLAAENFIRNSGIDFLICRSSVFYGWNPWRLNFITWVLKCLKLNQNISITKHEVNSPTFIINLAHIILKLIEKNASGIYHTVGDCALSRYEMALKCAKIFNYNDTLILPVDSINQKAQRPENVSLDISKLKNLIGIDLKICNLDDGLKYMRANPS